MKGYKPPANEELRGDSDGIDPAVAASYVGKTLLIGVTYLDHQECVTGQEQWFGTIKEVSIERGIVVDLEGSDQYCAIPPCMDSLQPAPPGEYRLRGSGQIVVDPDFLTTWERKSPPPVSA
jgi:hypothetical protein